MIRPKRKVALLSIDFSWENKDYTEVALPLFPQNAGWHPDNRSFAAYSIADTREMVEKGQLKIRARFQKSTSGGRIQVRTVNSAINIRDIFTGKALEKYPGKKALGTVKPKTIFFSESSYSIHRGKNTHVPLTLENVRFSELGVGIYDINWIWEYRVLDESKTTDKEDVWEDKWRPITLTQHRIFVVLEKPNFPWTPYQIPDYTKGAPYPLPLRAEAMYFACEWARGATSKEQAAKMITDRLYASGRLVYDVNPHYYDERTPNRSYRPGGAGKVDQESDFGLFHLNKMIERLNGGHGTGESANCVDCGLTVAALSNVLGCNLQVGKLQNSENLDPADPDFFTDNRFEVNPIQAIGHQNVDQTMADLLDDDRHYFSFHAVAFQSGDDEANPGEFGAEDMLIYDACVAFATDEDCGDSELRSAGGLPFEATDGNDGYQALLAAPTRKGRHRCKPQPLSVLQIQMC